MIVPFYMFCMEFQSGRSHPTLRARLPWRGGGLGFGLHGRRPLDSNGACDMSQLRLRLVDDATPCIDPCVSVCCRQMQVDNLSRGRTQPFYKVLVDMRERNGRQLSYVAEENIDSTAAAPPDGVQHFELGRYFKRRVQHPVVRNQLYVPNDVTAALFPEDWAGEVAEAGCGDADGMASATAAASGGDVPM